MSLRDELQAIRLACALTEVRHVVCLKLTGDDVFSTLDRLVTSALTLQDAQLKTTLLLREDGTVFADALVGRDDEAYWLMTEGPTVSELTAWVTKHQTGPGVSIERIDETHRHLAVHGPWAWQLLATCLGPDVMGMPYLSLLRSPSGVVCFRAGKTGEYGYELLVPNAAADELTRAIEKEGQALELRRVGLEALDLCSFENWFFSMRREGTWGLTPLELGLQWRCAPQKAFIGSEALAAKKAHGFTHRLTCLVVEGEVAPKADVMLDGERIGQLEAIAYDPLLDRRVASARLPLALAVPGVPLSVGGVGARTCSPPILINRSLSVSAQRHTWADRELAGFPPLLTP